MISATTKIEAIIISRNSKLFNKGIIKFIKTMLPIALVNNFLKYSIQTLTLLCRKRITENLQSQLLHNFTYYQINNLDSRIHNADQLITDDVQKFSKGLIECYSNTAKPLLDMIVYVLKLTQTIGLQGPGVMIMYLLISGSIMTFIRAPAGQLTVAEQQLEGEFRYINSRLITNSEEIAFYRGNKKEEEVLNNSFHQLITLLKRAMLFKFSAGVIDSIVAKYFATIVGFYVVSRPFLDDLNNPKSFNHLKADKITHAFLTEYYYSSGRMLMRLADSIGRLVSATRELTKLAGYTSRINEFQTVLTDLKHGSYVRTMINQSQVSKITPNTKDCSIYEVNGYIKFDAVPIKTPNNDLLVKNLSFSVTNEQNCIIVGGNGTGKSSLFRVLAGLWPIFSGTIHKPPASQLFYVPQKPYMSLGTLRDQVIYPHTINDMKLNNKTDADLDELMKDVKLSDMIIEQGGWDSIKDWIDVLSGGQKQRIAMARLLYHKPQFAILDECTSAVSIDVEDRIYQRCRQEKIGLFTISHRKTLWKHHQYVLALYGKERDYEFDFKEIKNIDANKVMNLNFDHEQEEEEEKTTNKKKKKEKTKPKKSSYI